MFQGLNRLTQPELDFELRLQEERKNSVKFILSRIESPFISFDTLNDIIFELENYKSLLPAELEKYRYDLFEDIFSKLFFRRDYLSKKHKPENLFENSEKFDFDCIITRDRSLLAALMEMVFLIREIENDFTIKELSV
ncbi:MAG: hypothetical protein RBS56_01120 [Candidatus Gracilibacteria bacterium]|jgi:hypothetical protein|nr:hypothetical protein [Candidatus Gracilibacteria bacterium]